MEFPLTTVVGVLLLLLALAASLFRRSLLSSLLPPSPGWALPGVGHLHLLLGKLPHCSLMQLSRKHGAVMFLKLGRLNTVVVSDPEVAREFLSTHDLNFADRPNLLVVKELLYNSEDMAGAPYGSNWKLLRKLCFRSLLSSAKVSLFSGLRQEEVSLMISKMQKQVTVELREYLFEVNFRMIMGMVTREPRFGSLQTSSFMNTIIVGEAVSAGIGDFVPSLSFLDLPLIKWSRKLHATQDVFLESLIQDKLQLQHNEACAQAEDFVEVLLAASQIPMNSVKGLLLDIIGGAVHGPTAVVEWAMAELLLNPHVLDKVEKEFKSNISPTSPFVGEHELKKLPYLQAVVKETFRLHPPGPLLVPRMSKDEAQVMGYTIPAKTQLLINAYAMGRDPKVWERPLEFMPERFMGGGSSINVTGQSFQLIPFGSGTRMCPGMTLSLIQVPLVLANLLHAFKWSSPEKIDLGEELKLILFKHTPLKLVPIPR